MSLQNALAGMCVQMFIALMCFHFINCIFFLLPYFFFISWDVAIVNFNVGFFIAQNLAFGDWHIITTAPRLVRPRISATLHNINP